MSDIYIPGIRSRFNSDQIIEDLMRLERIPQERTQRNIENLQAQKGYWQEVGRRINSLRESARLLYSFQNPFSERIANSADPSVITASATREASEQSYSFAVKQTAQADRFLSVPIDERMRVEAGTYTFTIGNDRIPINFRGGTMRDFVDVINNRGRDKISASLIAIQSGTRSLLIESKVMGAENRLSFHDDAVPLVVNIGMMEHSNDSRREVPIATNTVRSDNSANVSINDGVLNVGALSSASLPIGISLSADSPVMLRLETSTRVEAAEIFNVPQPPPGPSIPSGGSVTYGDITIENEPSAAPLPQWVPPQPPRRVDDMAVLSLVFSDGSSAKLPPISDSGVPVQRQYRLSDVAQGRTIVSLRVENANTHRDVSVSNVEIFDPTATDGGLRPLNIVSTARDAFITMEGIEITRPSNSINDLVPGVTLNIRGVSERPVDLSVRADTEGVKNAIISFVGNYNRLVAEINILTASVTRGMNGERSSYAESLVDELTYLTAEEAAEMKERLGAFSGDTTLNTFKSNLQRTVTAPYPTSLERDLTLLAQIGISTNAGGGTGYSPSRLRGYLEINERTLDAALETKIPAIRQLFASDTTGDLIMDTGLAVNIDALVRPFVETGGIISLKTGTIDSRISQDERRVSTMERQLASKEAELRIQYARMEAAYAQMEQMSTSLDNFNQQNSGNNR